MKNNPIERTDTVENITPNTKFGSGSQKLVFLLLAFGGLLLICFGVYVRSLENNNWIPEVCIAVGIAITTPGILSWLYRRFMLDEIKLEIQKPAQDFKDTAEKMICEATQNIVDVYRKEIELIKSSTVAGLAGIYSTRQSGIEAFLPYLDDERREILIVGSSLKGLLKDENDEYIKARELLKRKKDENPKMKLRFLFTHPIVADLRADQENRPRTEIGKEIIESIELLLTQWKISPLHIKVYVGTPTSFGIKTSQGMLLNPYPYMKEAYASPCFIIEKSGFIFTHFEQSHFNAWNSNMAKPIKNDLDIYRENLESYSHIIGEIYKQDSEKK